MSLADPKTAMRTTEVRVSNRATVTDCLRRAGSITRAELSNRTSLTSQALGPILAGLVDEGIVLQELEPRGGRGRPAMRYSLVPTATLSALIIQRSVVAEIYLGNALGELLAYRHVDSRGGRPAREVLRDLAAELDDLLVDSGLDSGKLDMLTLALEGAVDTRSTVVRGAEAWVDDEVQIDELLRPFLPPETTLVVKSSASAMALAALAAVDRVDTIDDELVAIVQLSIGTWMFLAQGGELLHGGEGSAGKLCHVPIAGNDLACSCGKTGCFATVVGHKAIAREFTALTGNRVSGGVDVLRKAADGDRSAEEVTDTAGRWLVKGLEPLLRMARPDRLVITSSAAVEGPSFTKDLHDLFSRELSEEFAELKIDVLLADLSWLLAP